MSYTNCTVNFLFAGADRMSSVDQEGEGGNAGWGVGMQNASYLSRQGGGGRLAKPLERSTLA